MERMDLPTYNIPIDGKWVTITNSDMRRYECVNYKLYRELDFYIGQYQRNPLSFFLPHGPADPINGNQGRAILNDYEHDFILVTSPNQCGKTTIGCAYTLLRCIPCDKEWPIFTQHGVKHKEWDGPKIVIIGTYSWDLMNSIWNTYRSWIPRSELQTYALRWGTFAGEKGKQREMRFHNIGKEMTLACGTRLVFMCYRQSLSQWESRQGDIVHLDEQAPEDQFDAVSQRQITRGDYTPIIATLTGHVIPDRPDTGGAGWIKRKVVDKGVTKGRKVGQYKLDIPSTPCAIMSDEKKRKLRIHWVVEPEKNRDHKKIREAEARYHGGWQEGDGLTFDAFDKSIHVIKPFDIWQYKPTVYRMIDHGTKPLAVGWFAVMPWGDIVMFDEFYEDITSIDDGVHKIVKKSGNELQQVSETYREEIQCGMKISSCEIDGRSFGTKSPDSGKTIGQVYNECGLSAYAASGQPDTILIPLAREMFSLRKDRKNIEVRIKRRAETERDRYEGSPILYIFEPCYNVVNELMSYSGKDKDDHQISCLKFMASRDRPYLGDYGLGMPATDTNNERQETVSKYTGY